MICSYISHNYFQLFHVLIQYVFLNHFSYLMYNHIGHSYNLLLYHYIDFFKSWTPSCSDSICILRGNSYLIHIYIVHIYNELHRVMIQSVFLSHFSYLMYDYIGNSYNKLLHVLNLYVFSIQLYSLIYSYIGHSYV